jgi:ankyrin repeat protein
LRDSTLALLPSLVIAKNTASLNERLVQVASRGDLALVKTLLDKGASVDADSDGRAALSKAQMQNHADVVRYLKEHGAK